MIGPVEKANILSRKCAHHVHALAFQDNFRHLAALHCNL